MTAFNCPVVFRVRRGLCVCSICRHASGVVQSSGAGAGAVDRSGDGSSTRISIVVVIFIRFSLFPLCNTDGGDHNNAFVSTIINM